MGGPSPPATKCSVVPFTSAVFDSKPAPRLATNALV